FTVATSEYGSYAVANNEFKSIHVNGTDGVSEGNETYEFVNDKDTYVIIGISSGNMKPKVVITETFEDGAKKSVEQLKEGYPRLENKIKNGDFQLGAKKWYAVDATFETADGIGRMKVNSSGGGVRQRLGARTKGNKMYVSF